jgi:hypothetical protein
MPLLRSRQTATEVTEHMSRARRLRALNRLLGYALMESKNLDLTDLDNLLGAAALAVSDELDVEGLSRKSAASCERSPPKSR